MLSRVASGFRSLKSRISIRKNFGNFDMNPTRTGVCRGKDEYGNTYWEDVHHSKTGSGSTTRWIMPADVKRYDASSIPPGWFGWLHSTTDHPPQEDPLLETQPWVERREPLRLSHMGAVGEIMPPGYLSHQMDCKPDHEHSHIQHMRMEMGDPIPEPKYSPQVQELINANIDAEPPIPDPVMKQRQPYLANPDEAPHHGRNIVGRMVGQDHYVPWVGAHYEKEPVKVI